MADALAVWLYGTNVARIEQVDRRRLRLTYTNEALGIYPGGVPLLSLALPLSADRFSNAIVRSFLDGLLPEGEPRRLIAEDLRLRADDTFGLVSALGRDCAGALVIQPDSDPAPPPATTTSAEPLDEDALVTLIDNLKTVPLGVGSRVRISLAGVQEKLLLTRLPDGNWGRPVDGTPSTHILKPEIRGYPDTVQNEAFCMRLAAELGLQVAKVEAAIVRGRPLLVVERFDRIVHANGDVERIHQEDFCQATGNPPSRKYQENGGPPLKKIATILRSTDRSSLESLLRAVVLHVLVGNGDAHGKNYALLHEPTGSLRMAPLYDVLSTMYYKDDKLAMYIDDVRRTDRVTVRRIINEASSWRIGDKRASAIVDEVIANAPLAIDRATDGMIDLPNKIPELVRKQLRRLTS